MRNGSASTQPASAVPSMTKTTRPRSANMGSEKKQYKSKLAANQMEAIVSNLRSRLSHDKITNMSNDELQKQVLSEIMNEKKKGASLTLQTEEDEDVQHDRAQ